MNSKNVSIDTKEYFSPRKVELQCLRSKVMIELELIFSVHLLLSEIVIR